MNSHEIEKLQKLWLALWDHKFIIVNVVSSHFELLEAIDVDLDRGFRALTMLLARYDAIPAIPEDTMPLEEIDMPF